MIVLKATQEKVLAVLQSVAGIVERRDALHMFSHYAIIRGDDRIFEVGEIPAPVLVHAPKLAACELVMMCKNLLSPRSVCRKRRNRRSRREASCWRLMGDGNRRKRLNA